MATDSPFAQFTMSYLDSKKLQAGAVNPQLVAAMAQVSQLKEQKQRRDDAGFIALQASYDDASNQAYRLPEDVVTAAEESSFSNVQTYSGLMRQYSMLMTDASLTAADPDIAPSAVLEKTKKLAEFRRIFQPGIDQLEMHRPLLAQFPEYEGLANQIGAMSAAGAEAALAKINPERARVLNPQSMYFHQASMNVDEKTAKAFRDVELGMPIEQLDASYQPIVRATRANVARLKASPQFANSSLDVIYGKAYEMARDTVDRSAAVAAAFRPFSSPANDRNTPRGANDATWVRPLAEQTLSAAPGLSTTVVQGMFQAISDANQGDEVQTRAQIRDVTDQFVRLKEVDQAEIARVVQLPAFREVLKAEGAAPAYQRAAEYAAQAKKITENVGILMQTTSDDGITIPGGVDADAIRRTFMSLDFARRNGVAYKATDDDRNVMRFVKQRIGLDERITAGAEDGAAIGVLEKLAGDGTPLLGPIRGAASIRLAAVKAEAELKPKDVTAAHAYALSTNSVPVDAAIGASFVTSLGPDQVQEKYRDRLQIIQDALKRYSGTSLTEGGDTPSAPVAMVPDDIATNLDSAVQYVARLTGKPTSDAGVQRAAEDAQEVFSSIAANPARVPVVMPNGESYAGWFVHYAADRKTDTPEYKDRSLEAAKQYDSGNSKAVIRTSTFGRLSVPVTKLVSRDVFMDRYARGAPIFGPDDLSPRKLLESGAITYSPTEGRLAAGSGAVTSPEDRRATNMFTLPEAGPFDISKRSGMAALYKELTGVDPGTGAEAYSRYKALANNARLTQESPDLAAAVDAAVANTPEGDANAAVLSALQRQKSFYTMMGDEPGLAYVQMRLDPAQAQLRKEEIRAAKLKNDLVVAQARLTAAKMATEKNGRLQLLRAAAPLIAAGARLSDAETKAISDGLAPGATLEQLNKVMAELSTLLTQSGDADGWAGSPDTTE